MVAVGTLECEHVTQLLAVWSCLPCSLCLDSGISVDCLAEKTCLFTGFTKEGKTQSQRQRDFRFPTSCLISEINFILYRASWEGPPKKVSWLCAGRMAILLLGPGGKLYYQSMGEGILDLKWTQIANSKGTTSSYWAKQFHVSYWLDSYISYLR